MSNKYDNDDFIYLFGKQQMMLSFILHCSISVAGNAKSKYKIYKIHRSLIGGLINSKWQFRELLSLIDNMNSLLNSDLSHQNCRSV